MSDIFKDFKGIDFANVETHEQADAQAEAVIETAMQAAQAQGMEPTRSLAITTAGAALRSTYHIYRTAWEERGDFEAKARADGVMRTMVALLEKWEGGKRLE